MKEPFEMIIKMKRTDEMFDLLLHSIYLAGQFGNVMPVDESRKIFQIIQDIVVKKKLKDIEKFISDDKIGSHIEDYIKILLLEYEN